MDILNSVLLGIIQGLTEFLPISSSGHLILARDLTNTQFSYGLAFDSILQLATTIAILVFFRKDIYKLIKSFFNFFSSKEPVDKKQKILIWSIIVGTIPAIILGFFLEDIMDTAFRNSLLVSLTLVLGSIVMFLADRVSKNNTGDLTIKKSIIIGLFQSLALIPGMSRSGMTISGGLFANIKREEAIRFSFLLAIPVLLGSGIKKIIDLGTSDILSSIGFELLVGSLVSFIVGLLAIKFLISYLKNHNFNIFIYYRLILAFLILVISLYN